MPFLWRQGREFEFNKTKKLNQDFPEEYVKILNSEHSERQNFMMSQSHPRYNPKLPDMQRKRQHECILKREKAINGGFLLF